MPDNSNSRNEDRDLWVSIKETLATVLAQLSHMQEKQVTMEQKVEQGSEISRLVSQMEWRLKQVEGRQSKREEFENNIKMKILGILIGGGVLGIVFIIQLMGKQQQG